MWPTLCSPPGGSWNISALLHNSVGERHTHTASENETKAIASALEMKGDARGLKVRCYAAAWMLCSPMLGGSSSSHSLTPELWVAGRLTRPDTGESAWVEREQPWEQCLPATLETRQPPFWLKSQNHAVLYCKPSPGLENTDTDRKLMCLCGTDGGKHIRRYWLLSFTRISIYALDSLIQKGHSEGSLSCFSAPQSAHWVCSRASWIQSEGKHEPGYSDRSTTNKSNFCFALSLKHFHAAPHCLTVNLLVKDLDLN